MEALELLVVGFDAALGDVETLELVRFGDADAARHEELQREPDDAPTTKANPTPAKAPMA